MSTINVLECRCVASKSDLEYFLNRRFYYDYET
ncbi:hypothetical protein R80B4_01510 [Fibrobacteres bacterium R8-0-B4]